MVRAIVEWQELRSPILAVTDSDGAFLGYVRCKPNETNDTVSRYDGQVAVLAQVAVTPSAQRRGIGTALVARAIKTLSLFQYTRVFAQVQPHLVEWYQSRGWKVQPAGRCPAWIEPLIRSDDEWFPDLPPGTFAPLLSMVYLPTYPHLVEYQLRDEKPFAQVWVDGRAQHAEVLERVHRALLALFDTHPDVEARLPSALRRMIRDEAIPSSQN